MYTHIERWWSSVLLLLMGRETQEGILQENNLNTIFTPTHASAASELPNYHEMFCEFLLFCYICLLGGYEWRKKGEDSETWTKNSSALLPSPLCIGLYLMYIHSHPVILQSPLVVESGLYAVVP